MAILGTDSGSEMTEFIWVCLSNYPKSQFAFYCTMVVVCLITFVSNSLIVVMVRVDDQPHTPMYFSLRNLSFLDICYSSNSVPFLLFNGLKDYPTISYTSCYG